MCFLLNPIEFEVSLNETQVSEMGPVSKSLLRRELTCKESARKKLFLFQDGEPIVIVE